MEPPSPRTWRWDFLWVVVCGIASSAWCVSAASQLGATFDEPIYIKRGLERWRSGSHSGLLKLGTMPLPPDVQTLPLYLWERWRGEPFDPDRDMDRLLPVARAGTLLFWWLLLVYGFLAARHLAGPWAGRLAVAMLASEPSLLAHAGLATTDIAVSASVLALAHHFRVRREPGRSARWIYRVGLPLFWFGAAVLAKASGLVYGVVTLFIIELERLVRGGAFAPPVGGGLGARLRAVWSSLRPFRRDLAWIVGGGLGLVFLYCGCDWEPQADFVKWAHGLPEGPGRPALVWLAEHLRIFSNAGEGIVRQVKHNMHGHGAYLLGRTDPRSLWFYFPVLLTIKLSLPLLLAPIVLAVCRPRALVNWACLAAAALVVLSLTFRVQIGVRLVLPLVVLTVVGLAAAVVQAGRTCAPTCGRLLGAGAAAGVAWTAAAALTVWPQGLCYTNEFWGGTWDAYRYVSESNYDWGQGLKELAAWQRRHGLESLDVWYFGADPAVTRPPIRQVPLHLPPVRGAQDVRERVRGKYLAVSTTMLYGNPGLTAEHRRAAAFLHRLRPIDRTTTFLIFDFSEQMSRR